MHKVCHIKSRIMTITKKNTKTSTKKPILPDLRAEKSKQVKAAEVEVFTPSGLTPKEKHYIITKCEKRQENYPILKEQAEHAIVNNKIFSIYGSCSTVRKSLIERGWVEKLLSNKMNLRTVKKLSANNKSESKELERLLLSQMMERYYPALLWNARSGISCMNELNEIKKEILINKLGINSMWTSKEGLCASMEACHWFSIEGVSEARAPRTFCIYEKSDVKIFEAEFKFTACTSLLKWFLDRILHENDVSDKNGNIPHSVIKFAINRCKEYMLTKQNRDIDTNFKLITHSEWQEFLDQYYLLVSNEEKLMTDVKNEIPVNIKCACVVLKEMEKYRPELYCEGWRNIWIMKPTTSSRGRGIKVSCRLSSMLDVLNYTVKRHVVQKYIEEPLLIFETKFDIRQYYLVTSTYPLIIWMYKNCYLKFSSRKFSLDNFHEAIHLTNHAIQKKYRVSKDVNQEVPTNKMWSLDKFIDYLKENNKGNVWDDKIYPSMKKAIIAVMLSCQDSMTMNKKRFELFGCDFLLDKEFNPWLIEINGSPDLNGTTSVTANICPAVLKDTIKVVIDYADDRNADTGNFECIYKQPMTAPQTISLAADLFVQGRTIPLNYVQLDDIVIPNVREMVDR